MSTRSNRSQRTDSRQLCLCKWHDRVQRPPFSVHNKCPQSIQNSRWLCNRRKYFDKFAPDSDSLHCPSSHSKSSWPPHKCQWYNGWDRNAKYHGLNRPGNFVHFPASAAYVPDTLFAKLEHHAENYLHEPMNNNRKKTNLSTRKLSQSRSLWLTSIVDSVEHIS